jgi:hypothetical protein
MADFARAHPEYDFGIHLALTSEWNSLRWGGVEPDDPSPVPPGRIRQSGARDQNRFLPPFVGRRVRGEGREQRRGKRRICGYEATMLLKTKGRV